MLADYVQHVAEIFGGQLPHLSYRAIPNGSIRNALLAHYMAEHSPTRYVEKMLAKDTDRQAIEKLLLMDVTYLLIGKGVFFKPERRRRWFWSNEDEAIKHPVRIGTVYPNSTLDKTVMICGVEIYKYLARNNQPKPVNLASNRSMRSYLADLAFSAISEGANPVHAASCYLELLAEERLEQRVAASETVTELKLLLGFRFYQERIVQDQLREEGWDASLNFETPSDVMFLISVLNWNKGILDRIKAI